MFHKFRWAGTLALLCLGAVCLSACETFETGHTKIKRVKTVGVISAIGDEFSFTRSGLNGMNDGTTRVSIASWGLDDLIVGDATAAIGKDFQVVPLSYDHATFYASTEKDSPLTPLNLMHPDPLKRLLRAQSSPQSFDAYIIIVKSKSPIGPSNRTVSGIGAVAYKTLMGSYYKIHALYEIKVYDGHNFNLIETRPAAPLRDDDVARLGGPTLTVDATYMPSAGDPVQNEKLKAAVIDIIERSLGQTLRDLHLADEVPPA